ncbi:MAG: aminotransferase class V-fold PLP-dependent enzyme [Myxococcales bacterium]|nr:aminotransferase class V-fold PLP-dependent enzyme [Myxococcales bacterium]
MTPPARLAELRRAELAAAPALYFNTASQGPTPARARGYVERALVEEMSPSSFPGVRYREVVEELRTLFARLVGAHPEHVAISTSTSEIISICASSLEIPSGGRVACIDDDFPSPILPWLARREARGTPVDLLVPPEGWPPTAAWLDEAMSPHTAVLSMSWVHFATGARIDLAGIGEVCRRRGIFFILDATQGVGAEPIDFEASAAQVLACSGYKWTLGPYGIGYGCFTPEAIERLRAHAPHWLMRSAREGYSFLTDYHAPALGGARRFDRGEPATPLVAAAAKAGIEVTLEVGLAAIVAHREGLVRAFLEGLDADRYALVTPAAPEARAAILSIRPLREAVDAVDARLRGAGVYHSLREGVLRFAFHWFNTAEEVARLGAALHA